MESFLARTPQVERPLLVRAGHAFRHLANPPGDE